MTIIKPETPQLATHMSELISQNGSHGKMIQIEAIDILRSCERWQVILDPDQNVAGFCQVKPTLASEWSELGSVYSNQSVLKLLLREAESYKSKTLDTLNMCAVTSSFETAQKFQKVTDGQITAFPPWFPRVQDDRQFVVLGRSP